ncbi:MAG TPA: PhzF family phenazine biosynthesis protein, partial [Dongiaceae bacterium]|jgi:PhzF family phenazine biosynthesis protein
MALKFFQVDAFSSKPFAGNPAAVMPLPEWLPDATLQAIAAEHNLAETAFFVPQGRDFHLRWFTPTVEMDLCGHATLASAYIVLNELDRSRDNVVFHTRSGALTVTRDGDRLTMDFPALKTEPASASEVAPVEEALGAKVIDLRKGWTYIAVLESEDAVRTLAPDTSRIAALPRDVIATARGAKADFVSRAFVPKVGIPEDPVTGKAHCGLVPYWSEVLERKTFFARQLSKRGGELWLRLEGDRVKISGHAVLTVTGQVHI